MVTKRELALVRELRKDSRQLLTDVGKALSIPPSSLHSLVKRLEGKGVIKRYVSLVDFGKIGFPVRVLLSLSVKERERFQEFMMKHGNVNSLSRIMGDRFLAELVFVDMLELEEFLEQLKGFGVEEKEIFHVVEEFKREEAELTREGTKTFIY